MTAVDGHLPGSHVQLRKRQTQLIILQNELFAVIYLGNNQKYCVAYILPLAN